MKKPVPSHPGTILLEEFIQPLDLTAYQVAKACGIPQSSMTQIVNGNRSISPENALRFGRYFGTSAEFWTNLQSNYDLRLARREMLAEIESKITPLAA